MSEKNLMVIPEYLLHSTISSMLAKVRLDFAAHSADTTKSLLYKMTQGITFERYAAFTELSKIICGKKDDPRRLEVDLMFNLKRNGPPTIHITLPAETAASQGNGLGTDENYEDPQYDTDEVENTDIVDGDNDADVPETTMSVFSRRFRAAYNVVVTSDNSNEVVVVYHFIRQLLISAIPHLSLAGIENVSFGGNDVRPYTDVTANQLYMRAIIVNMEYDTYAFKLDLNIIPDEITTTGTPLSM